MNSRLRRPAGALLATAVAASILGAVPSAYAVDGTISGTVAGPGGDLEGISVKAWVFEDGFWGYSDAEGSYDSTDATGSYTLTLPAGPYRIGFDDSEGGHIEEFYNDAPTVESAETVTVGGTPLVLDDAVLATASHITGTVTGPGGAALEAMSVAAYQELSDQGQTYWQAVEYADTDVSGNYDLGGLTAGTYRVEFKDFGGELDDPTYANEFFQNQPSVLVAQDIAVGPQNTTSGVDAELALESTISGTVTDVNNAPLVGAQAYASVQAGAEWDYAGFAETDAAGNYTFDGLPTGTYKVEFQYGDGPDSLFEVYNNKGTFDAGDNIAVGTAAAVGGISAQLVAGEHDLKYLEGVTIPEISGTPQVGSTLSVTAGTWTPSDITATYQWFNDDGPIAGATASTYVPAAADLGKTLVVLVEASKPGYENRMNMSNVVGPIVAAPVVAPPVVAPPVVTPAPVPAPAPAPAPVISFSKKIDVAGALTVGSTLKLKNFKALVSRAAVSYKIQWYSGSKKIKKATKSKLKVTQALKGKKISVKVSATSGTTTKTVKVKVGKIR